jgi:hypothetical protein
MVQHDISVFPTGYGLATRSWGVMGLTASQPEENTEQQGHIEVYDGGINGGYNRGW